MGIKDKFSKKTKPDKSTTDTVKKELHTEYEEDKKQVIVRRIEHGGREPAC